MKEWPKDETKTVSFLSLIPPLKRVLRKGYEWKEKKLITDIPYTGYNIGKDTQATVPSPKERFKKKSLKWEKEDQGRDLLDIVLATAFQLGIEQGKRIQKEKEKEAETMVKLMLR